MNKFINEDYSDELSAEIMQDDANEESRYDSDLEADHYNEGESKDPRIPYQVIDRILNKSWFS